MIRNEFTTCIMNFDNVYKEENFYRDYPYDWINCSDIKGANCYCDEQAKELIRQRIKPYTSYGIHYIDSGNYHYVTELWLEKVKEPFVLVVFDHHTDMQPSLFEQLLSCGSWVKQVIDTNPYLQKVFILKPKKELVNQMPEKYKEKVICYPDSIEAPEQILMKHMDQYQNLPFYLSIDKDVLSQKETMTNWDQGEMTLPQLEQFLVHIMEHHPVIGVDICGEYPQESEWNTYQVGLRKNNKVNQELLQLISLEHDKLKTQIQSEVHHAHSNNYIGHLSS